MISLGSLLIACCKLAQTLARKMWRHNYVIDRNEYLIFTFSESINHWVYSVQFLFKSTNNSWRYERKCEWVFFFWTQCTLWTLRTHQQSDTLNYWKGNFAQINRDMSAIDWDTKLVGLITEDAWQLVTIQTIGEEFSVRKRANWIRNC